MQPLPIQKRASIIDTFDDNWEECVLTGVLHLLKDETPGQVCISTPAGRECRVFVLFRNGGRA